MICVNFEGSEGILFHILRRGWITPLVLDFLTAQCLSSFLHLTMNYILDTLPQLTRKAFNPMQK